MFVASSRDSSTPSERATDWAARAGSYAAREPPPAPQQTQQIALIQKDSEKCAIPLSAERALQRNIEEGSGVAGRAGIGESETGAAQTSALAADLLGAIGSEPKLSNAVS
jgi:hypothetical protein